MVRVKKVIVENGATKSYSMLCDETQLESLLKDSRFTLEEKEEETEKEIDNSNYGFRSCERFLF